jgi:sugar transferase EpsL
VHGGKRLFDITSAAVALLLLSPLLLLAAVVVRLRLGSPVLFRQTRPGLRGVPFEIWKFRTMLDLRGTDGALLPDAERMTSVGRLLRRSSVDELPELLNVLRGEMSLVGPRPLLMEYLPLYTPEQFRRHEVRPGITGLAQTRGRNTLNWRSKFRYDRFYVDHQSFKLDTRILLSTVNSVLRAEGIEQQGRATVDRYTGQ